MLFELLEEFFDYKLGVYRIAIYIFLMNDKPTTPGRVFLPTGRDPVGIETELPLFDGGDSKNISRVRQIESQNVRIPTRLCYSVDSFLGVADSASIRHAFVKTLLLPGRATGFPPPSLILHHIIRAVIFFVRM